MITHLTMCMRMKDHFSQINKSMSVCLSNKIANICFVKESDGLDETIANFFKVITNLKCRAQMKNQIKAKTEMNRSVRIEIDFNSIGLLWKANLKFTGCNLYKSKFAVIGFGNFRKKSNISCNIVIHLI